jgi:hypothetical protein
MRLICNHIRCNKRVGCSHSVPHIEDQGCTINLCPIAYDEYDHNIIYCQKVEIGFNQEEIILKSFGSTNG